MPRPLAGELADLTQRFPRVRVVLLADRKLKPVEWLLREAGAVDVLFSLGDLPRLQPVLRRFWEQMPSLAAKFSRPSLVAIALAPTRPADLLTNDQLTTDQTDQ